MPAPRPDVPARRLRRRALSSARAAVLCLALPAALGVAPRASLRGSRASVARAYDWARARRLPFQPSRPAVERAARRGVYARLGGGGAAYRLVGVSVPYALPATAAWLTSLAPRHSGARGAPLVVTSAVRPTTLRLLNGIEQSVHPTRLAVDL